MITTVDYFEDIEDYFDQVIKRDDHIECAKVICQYFIIDKIDLVDVNFKSYFWKINYVIEAWKRKQWKILN